VCHGFLPQQSAAAHGPQQILNIRGIDTQSALEVTEKERQARMTVPFRFCTTSGIRIRPGNISRSLGALPQTDRGICHSECPRRGLFRQADLTEERLETWNGAERISHGIDVQENQIIRMFFGGLLEQADSIF
jgi:hypothetical protein